MENKLKKIWWEIVVCFGATFGATFVWIRTLLEPLGLPTGWLLWSIIVVTSFGITMGYIGFRLLIFCNKNQNIQNAMVNDSGLIIKHLKGIEELKIFASGSETYRTLLLSFLQECELKHKLKIKILVRNDETLLREQKIKEALDKWREDIDHKYNTMTEIRSYNFSISLRGLILDKKTAMLGWYYRGSKQTIGQDIPVTIFTNDLKQSKKIVNFASETFDKIFENGKKY